MSMRTTLNIDDALMRRLKRQAHEQGRTLTDLIEEALRQYTQPSATPPERFAWRPPITDATPAPVDFSDRDALFEAMERDR